ncbi:hypothetical protein [Bradyrhizobium genosp. P]|uniref:hypothetical protein n=1 Tax=Bradyrhizobium genosp. P TaxID=83641 RepID=UPI003CF0D806
MRRLSLNVCLVLFFLPVWGFNAEADENKSDSARIVPALKLECTPPRKAGEPFDPSSTSAIPHAEQFVAREHFKEDIAPTAEVMISWLGATFVRRFAGKVEAGSLASLQTYFLKSPSNDREIIAKLGGRHEINLADVWCLLRLQAKGEQGALETNSVPNIFFVSDRTGELGVVDAIWGGAGWEIGASPVGDRRTWPSGTRVISR